MTQVRFRDLTYIQIRHICNGCRGKGHWFDPPDWIFTASCDQHDFNYWIGHTEEDRKKADWQFYQAMLNDARMLGSWWNTWWYKLMAWVYYRAVRLFAKDFFYYGPAEKTLEDLEEELDV
jgi:hypothetical protein